MNQRPEKKGEKKSGGREGKKKGKYARTQLTMTRGFRIDQCGQDSALKC